MGPIPPLPEIGSAVTFYELIRAKAGEPVHDFVGPWRVPCTFRRRSGYVRHRWLAGERPLTCDVWLFYGFDYIGRSAPNADKWLQRFNRQMHADRIVVEYEPDHFTVLPWRASRWFTIVANQD